MTAPVLAPVPGARVVLIDIETYRTRNPRVLDIIRREAYDKEPSSNTLKELKATWNSSDAREKRARDAIAKTSVNVLHAEVLAVGVLIDGGEPKAYGGMWPPDSEETLLRGLAEDLAAATSAETVWAGHNVESFDFPILINRWRRWGIAPPPAFPQPHGSRWRGRIYDTMQRIPSGHGLGMVSLRDACLAYGLPEPKTKLALPDGRPMCGALVGEAFEAREYATIEAYLLEDMAAGWALYEACTVGGEWGTWEADAELEQAIAAIWATREISSEKKASIVLEALAGTGKIPRRYAGMEVAHR